MPDIVLTTLNAKYIHAAFGLRYLLANLGPLQPRARIVEFDINHRPNDVAEVLLAQNPKIIGIGVYIWNVTQATLVVAALKQIRPDITIILGGPEVSYETEGQEIVKLADYVITGEADLKFAEVCGQLLEGNKPATKIIAAGLPEFSQLKLPYHLYDDQDVAHRIIYVEASRGCPFTCEFCLSSLDIPVRQAPLPLFLAEMQKLLDRGVQQFKFVDRTFNLNLATSRAILEFFLERHQPGRFYHFEMIPDRLPAELRALIARFPAGSLQFEVGVQTFNPEVCDRISRKQNNDRLAENFRFLRGETGVHIHADLIVGLPGETLESFGAGFDRLIALRPQEIQVGILKRLRGTPIARHTADWQMTYSPNPPYEILQNAQLDFATLQRLRRFARYWDLVGNSGNFVETTLLIWAGKAESGKRESENGEVGVQPLGCSANESESRKAESEKRGTDSEVSQFPISAFPLSAFSSFLRFADWLFRQIGRTDSIALSRLMELLFEYLTQVRNLEPRTVALALWHDYQRGGRKDKPSFLCEYLTESEPAAKQSNVAPLKRQARHMAAS